MAELPLAVVDVHTHVFNAEDLPIDGFVRRRLAPTPRLLVPVLSRPLDSLAQWRAPGVGEKAKLVEMLAGLKGGAGDEDIAEVGGLERVGEELVGEVASPSDEEVESLFAKGWRGLGLLPGGDAELGDLEGLGDEATTVTDRDLVVALERAEPGDVEELQGWLAQWDESTADFAGLEGFPDLLGTVKKMKDAVRCFLWAVGLVTRYRYLIAANLATTYRGVSLFIPALVDFDQPSRDHPSTSVAEQIAIHSLVSKVSVAGLLPGAPETRVHPLVGFDPYREVAETALAGWDPDRGAANGYVPYADLSSVAPDDRYHRGIRFAPERARPLRRPGDGWSTAVLDLSGVHGGIDLARHAIELGGFVGVKIYPPAGFLPLGNVLRFGGSEGQRLDAAMRALYGYCETMQVPIFAHAAHSNGFAPGYDALAGPSGWELALAEYPDLRICFGHFGHLHGAGESGSGPWADAWFTGFVGLMDRYPHVYADVGNSKFAVSPAYRERFLTVLRDLLGTGEPDQAQSKRRQRLLYGSDFWMNTLAPGHPGFLTAFEDAFQMEFGTAGREAFMGRNALRFVGFTGDDDRPDFANLNRRRLEAFYDGWPRPPWLPAEGSSL
jgi:predicted TIM-barrel fold metal-dependent hydrolase